MRTGIFRAAFRAPCRTLFYPTRNAAPLSVSYLAALGFFQVLTISGKVHGEQIDQTVVSPSTIKAIAELLRAAGHVEDVSFFSAERLHGFSEVLSAISWPVVFILTLILFRPELRNLIKKTKKLGFGGASIEAEDQIEKTVDLSAREVLSSPNPEPPRSVSGDDIRRSAEVGALSQEISPEVLRSQIDRISAEYEGIRAQMPSGPARTKQMSAVMAKMRALGRAVFPLRAELVGSPSPGHRLFAIAALQMVPDYKLVDWLALAVTREVPYVQFQALNALLTAVRNAGPEMKETLREALAKAKSGLSQNDPDSSRWELADQIYNEINQMPDTQASRAK